MPEQQFAGAAYEDLLAAAMYGHSSSEARKLIDDFAHELAKTIRLHPGSRAWEAMRDDAADLIDPEAA